MFMVAQAAVATLLYRVGAGTDIPLGSPVSGRNDPALDDLVGFFVDTQVLRTDVGGHPRFDELIDRVRAVDLAAFDNQDIPFQQIVEHLAPRRVPGRNPLFCVSVGYLPFGSMPDRFLGVPATFEHLTSVSAKFDLAFGKLNLAPGMTVLDLTAAWGSALAYAVTECDVNVHGLTQSRRQYDCARKVVGDLTSPRSADVAHLDWDRAEVPVDGILAIGSLEHVHRERYDEFFAHAHSLLPGGGRMLLQTVIGSSLSMALRNGIMLVGGVLLVVGTALVCAGVLVSGQIIQGAGA